VSKLLIGASPSKLFHLQEFAEELSEFGVECKVVLDYEVYDGFPSRRIVNWFQSKKKFNDLAESFKPDAIFIDRQRHFGLAAIESKIPLFVHLRGDYWEEMKMAKQTLYKSFPRNIALRQWERIGDQCFNNAKVIVPICNYLEERVKAHYPDKPTAVMHQGINPQNWFKAKGMKLKHPCIGLVQSATIYEKTKEMLVLTKVLESFPDVMFYWVGDGPYRDYVLPSLQKYDNFKWLGKLGYPQQVREFLSEIDIYALISGIDMSPLTLQEAQLMELPAIATDVGGIPELMRDGVTGYLVEKGNSDSIINRIEKLLSDEKLRAQIGQAGRKYVEENFDWKVIAKKFYDILKSHVK
jgi:glycosyltransferase involved in cell wall biosynthesis